VYNTDATLNIEARIIGKRTPTHAPRHIAFPPALLQEKSDTENLFRLRDLIEYIVREEVCAFRMRQEERLLLRVLNPHEIADAESLGKITMGGPREAGLGQDNNEVDEEEAVQIALQGFVDGLYFVFLDGQQQHDLDAPVQPHPASTLKFIRLVPLAGG
jgi:hypothetical protein